MTRIAVLGAGKIGEALLAGLLAAGYSTDELVFTERHPERATELTARHRVAAVDVATAARAEIVVVAVKPQDIGPVLDQLGPALAPGAITKVPSGADGTDSYCVKLAVPERRGM